MRSTDLSDHHRAALGAADELLKLLPFEERQQLYEDLTGDWGDVLDECLSPRPDIHAFLSLPVHKQRERLDRLDTVGSRLLWFQARFAALQAANALRLAADAQLHLPGNSARQTLRYMSEAVHEARALPTLEDVLLLTPGW